MAGSIQINSVDFATESNGSIVLSGNVELSSLIMSVDNWHFSQQQITGGNAVATGFYAGSTSVTERKTINIPQIRLKINTTIYSLSSPTTLNLDTTGSWAGNETSKATASNRNGQDFYIYAVEPSSGTTPNFCLSANSTYPNGDVGGVTASATNSRKIGGFHCLCLSVGNITGHELINYETGDILPRSVWDAHKHRPESNPEGMIYSGNHLWVDIYLATTENDELVSAYNTYPQSGGTDADYSNSPTPYYHWYNFVDRFAEANKRLPVQSEFMRFALGSNEETNVTGDTFATKTTGGNVDTNSRRMISNFGVEDCSGAFWQWINETGQTGAGTSWVVQDIAGTANSLDNAQSIGRGRGFQVPIRGLVGGRWSVGSLCGSRGVNWANSPLNLYADLGARGVSLSKF